MSVHPRKIIPRLFDNLKVSPIVFLNGPRQSGKSTLVQQRQDGSIFGIEVKKSETVAASDFKGLKILAELAPEAFTGGAVLYSGKDVLPFGKKLWAVPIAILWE